MATNKTKSEYQNMSTNKISVSGDTHVTIKNRDWFGYAFTTIIGILATIVVAWYQLYITQKDSAAAEIERARSVKQTSVAIVEEHVLNNKKLEATRLSRLIDQRRRDENISIPLSVTEIVEQAEFNIASSHHLSVDTKESIKPIFDAFYSEQTSRSFNTFPNSINNAPLLNELAKKIQEGKSVEALATLKRLEESHSKDISNAIKLDKPSIWDSIISIYSSPMRIAFILLIYIAIIFYMLRRRSLRRYGRNIL
jgi:Tfp pilus assembly protein PilE